MGNLGLSELFVIFVVALVVVGPKRLPELGRAFGEALRAFQDTLKGGPDDDPPTSLPHRKAGPSEVGG